MSLTQISISARQGAGQCQCQANTGHKPVVVTETKLRLLTFSRGGRGVIESGRKDGKIYGAGGK